MATQTNFKPKQTVKHLLSVLPDRAREVLVKRYGLGKDTHRMTLDAIGKVYGITRERVRQIENYGLNNIRKSSAYKEEIAAFEEIEQMLHGLGGIIVEDDLLKNFSKDASLQNHLHFLLVVGEKFFKHREDDEFHHRWHVDQKLAGQIEGAIKKLYGGLKVDDIVPESEMVASFLEHLKDVNERYKNQEVIRRWLQLSKKLSRNPLGEWGLAHSPNIKAKGVRDYAYLVIRKHGSPIHFREVAKAIEKIFGRKAHIATTHNELIKDRRFVLVGRGLYALAEWGYMTGVVKDVIKKILEKHGPLNKSEIIDKVLKERYVKENTILVNLQDQKTFKRHSDGRYELIMSDK